MLESPFGRALAIAVCLAALVGLFVWFGALEPAPEQHDYPGGDEIVTDADRYVGQEVDVSGEVVATDPVRIEVDSDYGTAELRVLDAPDAAGGQDLRVFGTLADESTVEAEESLVRDGWEFTYMYVVSVIAALWVLGRTVRHWRFEPRSGMVPRDRPLSIAALTERSADASSEGETDG